MSTSQALTVIAQFIQSFEWVCAGWFSAAAAFALYALGHGIYDHLPGTRRREAARRQADRERFAALARKYVH